MTLAVLTGPPSNTLRVGIITSGKIGGAVIRNGVRRRLREIVRLHQDQVAAGTWMVLIARSTTASATYRQLKDEWLRLAKRASILTA